MSADTKMLLKAASLIGNPDCQEHLYQAIFDKHGADVAYRMSTKADFMELFPEFNQWIKDKTDIRKVETVHELLKESLKELF
jgi:hypothetical protein